MYRLSFLELFIFLFMIAIIAIMSLHNKAKFISYKIVFGMIFAGISWALIACIFNSISANHWDQKVIIEFLLLKDGNWLFRQLLLFGYANFINVAVAVLLVKHNKTEADKV